MSNFTQPCRAIDAADYVARLLNQPYDPVGQHCWAVTCRAQLDLFGRILPPVLDVAPQDREGARAVQAMFRDHPERQRWREISEPVHGALVLMHKPLHDHAGTYLKLGTGGILHSEPTCGVVFDNVLLVRKVRGWRTSFFTPV